MFSRILIKNLSLANRKKCFHAGKHRKILLNSKAGLKIKFIFCVYVCVFVWWEWEGRIELLFHSKITLCLVGQFSIYFYLFSEYFFASSSSEKIHSWKPRGDFSERVRAIQLRIFRSLVRVCAVLLMMLMLCIFNDHDDDYFCWMDTVRLRI